MVGPRSLGFVVCLTRVHSKVFTLPWARPQAHDKALIGGPRQQTVVLTIDGRYTLSCASRKAHGKVLTGGTGHRMGHTHSRRPSHFVLCPCLAQGKVFLCHVSSIGTRRSNNKNGFHHPNFFSTPDALLCISRFSLMYFSLCEYYLAKNFCSKNYFRIILTDICIACIIKCLVKF